jgi:hypothetical protein
MESLARHVERALMHRRLAMGPELTCRGRGTEAGCEAMREFNVYIQTIGSSSRTTRAIPERERIVTDLWNRR